MGHSDAPRRVTIAFVSRQAAPTLTPSPACPPKPIAPLARTSSRARRRDPDSIRGVECENAVRDSRTRLGDERGHVEAVSPVVLAAHMIEDDERIRVRRRCRCPVVANERVENDHLGARCRVHHAVDAHLRDNAAFDAQPALPAARSRRSTPPCPLIDKPRRTTVSPGRVDRHAITAENGDAGVDARWRDQRDRFRDGDGSVASGVEHDHLTARVGLRDGARKSTAGLSEATSGGVVAVDATNVR